MIKKLLLFLGVFTLIAIVGGIYWFNKTGGISRFTSLIKEAACADKRNDLYKIDDQYYLWVREGSCTDASYSYTLYETSPNEAICRSQDSEAGTELNCDDKTLTKLFKKMINHLDEIDLGLGDEHTVTKIDIY